MFGSEGVRCVALEGASLSPAPWGTAPVLMPEGGPRGLGAALQMRNFGEGRQEMSGHRAAMTRRRALGRKGKCRTHKQRKPLTGEEDDRSTEHTEKFQQKKARNREDDDRRALHTEKTWKTS